jgi:hypothetical protein
MSGRAASGQANHHARSVIMMMMMPVMVPVVGIGQEERTADEGDSKNGQDFFHGVPLAEMKKCKREEATAWRLL